MGTPAIFTCVNIAALPALLVKAAAFLAGLNHDAHNGSDVAVVDTGRVDPGRSVESGTRSDPSRVSRNFCGGKKSYRDGSTRSSSLALVEKSH